MLLSSDLPSYSGPYNVGAIDIEVPVSPRNIGKAVFKDNGEPAFKLETVLFTIYYPAASKAQSDKPKHLWVPKPVALHAEGYARFAQMNNFLTNSVFAFGLWMLAGGTEIPAAVDVPLCSGASEEYSDVRASPRKNERFPVIVFSHGMASCRTSYTQYCGELASQGFVVAAIEHRDGSGPGTVIMEEDGQERNVFHIGHAQLQNDGQPVDLATLKADQLSFRAAEVEETMFALRDLNEGRGAKVQKLNKRNEGQDLAAWEGRLDTREFIIGGHSYGATLALQALKGAPSWLPIKGGIILDPGKNSGPLNDDIKVPILIIHSNSWSSKHSVFFGRPHFEVVKDLVEKANENGTKAWFMTSLGTTHPSVTDAPLIEPMLLSWTTGSTIDVKEGVNQYVKVSLEFLDFLKTGERNGILAEAPMSKYYDHHPWKNSDVRFVPEEISKFWQVHVAP